ncbi:hypothetical protein [Caudoviricetes sp.]|nr:hypothetical protein [Caudoviricetes sp.]
MVIYLSPTYEKALYFKGFLLPCSIIVRGI